MSEFLEGLLVGLAAWLVIGLIALIIYAACAAGGKADLEREIWQLEYENKKLMTDLGEPYEPEVSGGDERAEV